MKVFIALLALFFSSFGAGASGELEFTKNSGPAPLSICVTGPAKFLETSQNCKFSEASSYKLKKDDFYLDWDDNNPTLWEKKNPGMGCSVLGCHTYYFPGTYKVSYKVDRPETPEAPATQWESSATITVTGESPEPVLVITQPVRATKLQPQKPAEINLRINTGKQLDIVLQKLSAGGDVIEEKIIPKASFIGLLKLQEPGTQKPGEFKLRVVLRDNGKTLLEATSPPFTR